MIRTFESNQTYLLAFQCLFFDATRWRAFDIFYPKIADPLAVRNAFGFCSCGARGRRPRNQCPGNVNGSCTGRGQMALTPSRSRCPNRIRFAQRRAQDQNLGQVQL
uniref:Uncharacterized protein n=1 Tax=Sipha flava TaxID=143950 RepID=A0A2S2QLJ1_9HEMI